MNNTRSVTANRYRWGVVVSTVLKYINAELEQQGCSYRATPDDIDLLIKEEALGIVHRIQTSLGEILITGKLKTRNTADFEEAMEQIRAHFAQRGIDIPLPNEVPLCDYENNFNKEGV
jgi:hypothetical protein